MSAGAITASRMKHAVTMRGVEKTYKPGLLRRTVPALRGLDLSVAPGEIYALIGPNGAGKTTTFRLLLGLARPDSGSGTLLGFPMGDPEARRRLGFLCESPVFYPFLRVYEMVRLAARLSGVVRESEAVDRALRRFDLLDLADRPLRKLSKGQLQRVGLAQSAVHEPELLILDEPMSGLDPLNRALVKGWIRELRAAGRTVLLASHILSDVEALADRVGILADGVMVAQGSSEELLGDSAAAIEVEFGSDSDPRPWAGEMGLTVEARGGLWWAQVPPEEERIVRALLGRVLRDGGSIRAVRHRGMELEDLLAWRIAERADRRVTGGAP